MNAPDPGWLPYMRWLYGFMLLVMIGGLVAIIALGKVEQSTSFGLQDLIGGLLVLAGSYANGMFGKGDDK